MGEEAHLPHISAELAQAVTRLGYLRRQLKELETEESLLRDRILSEISSWPRTSFPMKVGNFEVRLGERKGRVDPQGAYQVLLTQRLLSEVPMEPGIEDVAQVEALGHGLARLTMPEVTRSQLVQLYQGAIKWHPQVSQEILAAFQDQARLTVEQYRACFKDSKPVVVTLTVR